MESKEGRGRARGLMIAKFIPAQEIPSRSCEMC